MELLRGKFKYFLTASTLSVLFSGCLGTRYLQPGEKLVYKQSLEAPKGFSKKNLSNLYVQKANRRLFGLPINSLVWMYYTGAKRFRPEKFAKKRDKITNRLDKKIARTTNAKRKSALQYRRQHKIDVLNGKIENGNLFMQWGEKAAVYDSNTMAQSTEKLTDYLFTKGYFDAVVNTKTSEYKKRVSINYLVNPGMPFIYDSISFEIPDTKIAALIQKTNQSSLIKKGDRLDQEILNNERDRIDNLLKDNGYFVFNRNYIGFDIDTAFGGAGRIALRLKIENPEDANSHKQYRIDSTIFITDANTLNPGRERAKRQIRPYRDITFQYFKSEYSKRVLAQRVFLHRDSLYSRSNTINTQRQLANLNTFKFVNINYDTLDGKFTANIFSSKLDLYSWSNEAGLAVTQGFPGPFYNMSFLKRNLFGGLELFEVTGRVGLEGVAAATDQGSFFKSVEASLNATLTFPQFLFPFSEKAVSRFGNNNPRTKLLGGFTYSDRPEYQRQTFTFSYTYSWESKRTTQYTITLANLNIIQSQLDSAFRALLENLSVNQGNNIRLSFNPSFVSSIGFSMTWNPENYGNTAKHSRFMRIQAESGGTLLNFFTPNIIEREDLQLFKFLRFNVDYRKNLVLNESTVFAYRVNTGMAWAYGKDKILPYEKFFFVGGSNSVRAWRPRRLGVGSAPPLLSANPANDGLFDYSFEKPGDILLEGSFELRKKLVGFINGAVFLDWGNVWSFQENRNTTNLTEPNQAPWVGNTQFRIDNFYNEIGIGTGFGLRFDFSFLVLRFDVGIKVHDPARPKGERFVLDQAKFFRPFGTGTEPVIFNIGIGYPF